MKRKQERARQKALGGAEQREKVVRDVKIPETIVVSELANRMAERVADVVKALMNNGNDADLRTSRSRPMLPS